MEATLKYWPSRCANSYSQKLLYLREKNAIFREQPSKPVLDILCQLGFAAPDTSTNTPLFAQKNADLHAAKGD